MGEEWRDGFVRTGGLDVLARFATGMLSPDLSAGTLSRALHASWITVVYAVAGLTVALVIGLPLGVVASGVLASSALGRHASIAAARAVLGWMRAVHELVWAWLFVVAIGLSPFAAVFAIGIPYAGILGRIYARHNPVRGWTIAVKRARTCPLTMPSASTRNVRVAAVKPRPPN